MTNKQKFTGTVAAVAAVAAIGTSMYVRHNDERTQATSRLRADVAAEDGIIKAIQDANISVNGLLVRSVGGVVVVRGNGDKAAIADVLKKLNVARVANLVQPSFSGNDDAIRRDAERYLANSRALDGCMLRVSCENGILRVSGTVQKELQIDAARSVLRQVNGTKEVKVDLTAPAQS